MTIVPAGMMSTPHAPRRDTEDEAPPIGRADWEPAKFPSGMGRGMLTIDKSSLPSKMFSLQSISHLYPVRCLA